VGGLVRCGAQVGVRSPVRLRRVQGRKQGIDVEQVDSEDTLRRSLTVRSRTRNSENEVFECLKCWYENHADYNAAKNIGLRYLRCNQTGGNGGVPLAVLEQRDAERERRLFSCLI
jgi:transposase